MDIQKMAEALTTYCEQAGLSHVLALTPNFAEKATALLGAVFAGNREAAQGALETFPPELQRLFVGIIEQMVAQAQQTLYALQSFVNRN